ncbi:putative ribonuclease H-like domain-containing protein [Tanacetum coccineum]
MYNTKKKGLTMMKSLNPVVRIEAIRLFLAYASFKDFMVYQMDVKSAFLYGKIEEEVYVCQPPGFEDPDFPDRVYKVEKALYGLHQAPRAWYETLSTYLLDNEFQRGKIDKTLFIKRYKGDILLVQVYVDDIIFGSTKKELCNAFEIINKELVPRATYHHLSGKTWHDTILAPSPEPPPDHWSKVANDDQRWRSMVADHREPLSDHRRTTTGTMFRHGQQPGRVNTCHVSPPERVFCYDVDVSPCVRYSVIAPQLAKYDGVLDDTVFATKSERDTIDGGENNEAEERTTEEVMKTNSDVEIADKETDDELHAAEEHEAWRLREIVRSKRDRDERNIMVKERKGL